MNSPSRLRLRHLEVFVETARLGSVSRAAEWLNLTQPAVSRTLRELEATCGAPLVERFGRGVRLTAGGEVFLRHAIAGLDAMRGGVAAVAGERDAAPVRVGALPTVATALVPDAAWRYLRLNPSARLSIASGEQDMLIDRLRRGGLDLVVGRLPAPEDMVSLAFEPLSHDSVVFVVAARDVERFRTAPREALGDVVTLLPPAGSIIRPVVDRLFMELGLPRPRHVIETVSDSFGRAFLRRYSAVWIISSNVVAPELAAGEFAALPLDTASTLGPIGLTTRAGDTLSPDAAAFADSLRRAARERQTSAAAAGAAG
ncbi:pca operon transcription factor PcaQ [Acuticoccus sp. I52.16.1]|uniref:pca operon transcription factor PcaQ n=1 Tax=Acuticoccus sp. I52.16.1 TaxID=2928472 RepID=UPI001FCFF84F|nr:pca operon transcription factor PcaQ [Acuticoccus sp. I52.16.1]UOM34404.1 pca operon transcription factor PcaQ [Acuticoccus sp. I52.16.1]